MTTARAPPPPTSRTRPSSFASAAVMRSPVSSSRHATWCDVAAGTTRLLAIPGVSPSLARARARARGEGGLRGLLASRRARGPTAPGHRRRSRLDMPLPPFPTATHFTKLKDSLAALDATRMSHAIASPMPPPTAGPLIAAIVGTGSVRRDRKVV
jgi:hypothetical protein